MFAALIRLICLHPYWYTVLAAVPYLAPFVTSATPAICIIIAWTAARAAVVPFARRWQKQNTEQEAYDNGASDALMVVEHHLTRR